jgi:hypothetical protein
MPGEKKDSKLIIRQLQVRCLLDTYDGNQSEEDEDLHGFLSLVGFKSSEQNQQTNDEDAERAAA